MALFTLDTDSVSAAGSTINSLASQVSELSSTVSGYDTSAEDFDFASPKSVIAANIDACSIKVKNTASLIENVVSSHTALQSSLKYSGAADTTSTGDTSTTDTSAADTTTGDTSTYSGGDDYYSGGVSGYSSGGQESVDPTTEPPTEAPTVEDKEVTTEAKEVQYIYTDVEKLKDGESKELFTRKDFKYAENGYAMIGDRLVIACDQSYGKVGDVIDFVQKDGTVVSCVIGALTYSGELKNKVSFFVDKKAWTTDSPIEATKNLVANTTKTINRGNVDLLAAKEAQGIKANAGATNTGTSNAGTANAGNANTGSGSANIQGDNATSVGGVSTNTDVTISKDNNVYLTTDEAGNEYAVITSNQTSDSEKVEAIIPIEKDTTKTVTGETNSSDKEAV